MKKTNIRIKPIYCSYCKTSRAVMLGTIAALPCHYHLPLISPKLITTPDETTKKKAEYLVENLKDNIEKIQKPFRASFPYDLAKTFLILRKYEEARKIKKELYNTHRIFDFIEDEIKYGERISEIENDLEEAGKMMKDKPFLGLSGFIEIFLLYSKLGNKEKMKEYESIILSKIKYEDTPKKNIIGLEEYLKEIPFYLFKKIYSELDKSMDDEFLSLKDTGDESLYYLDKIALRNLYCERLKEKKEFKQCLDIYKKTVDLIEKECPNELFLMSLLILIGFPDEYKIKVNKIVNRAEKIVDKLSKHTLKIGGKIFLLNYFQKENPKKAKKILKEIRESIFFKKKPLCLSEDNLKILVNSIDDTNELKEYLKNYFEAESKWHSKQGRNFFETVNAYLPFKFLIEKFSQTKDKKWLNLLLDLEEKWKGLKGDLYLEIANQLLGIKEEKLAEEYLKKSSGMELSECGIRNKIEILKLKKEKEEILNLQNELIDGTLRFKTLVDVYFDFDLNEDEKEKLIEKIKEESSNIGTLICPNCKNKQ